MAVSKVQRPSANLFAMLGARIAKGETTDDVFGFLTAGVNAEVKASRPRAMSVILAAEAELENRWRGNPSPGPRG